MVACLKKVFSEELLTLALLLSLMRGDGGPPPPFFNPGVPSMQLSPGGSMRRVGAAPTPLNTLLARSTLKNMLLERNELDYNSLLSELATLAAPNPNFITNNREEQLWRGGGSFTTYLLTTQVEAASAAAGADEEDPPPVPPAEDPDESSRLQDSQDLSAEDMNLIEVLWKQDVDIGVPPLSLGPEEGDEDEGQLETPIKSLKETSTKIDEIQPKVKVEATEEEEGEGPLTSVDPWAGLPYTIDLETGEYELCKNEEESLLGGEEGSCADFDPEVSSVLPALDSFSLEEALKIAGLDQPKSESDEELSSECRGLDADDEMSQTAGHLHNLYAPKPHLEGRMQMVRGMEHQQRWSELSHFLGPAQPPSMEEHFPQLLPPPQGFPGGYLPDPRSVLLHNASLAPPPLPDFNSTSVFSPPVGNQGFCREVGRGSAAAHIGSAVATSMNLTNSSAEPIAPADPTYKMDHDPIYYQNNSTNGTESMNQTTEGFFSSMLNDEDLQLVDMAMNEGMYTMRLLDNSTGAGPAVAAAAGDADGSSDSAVSSMGSERGGAWGTEPSTSNSYLDYCNSSQNGTNKYRPYDYSGGAYGGNASSGAVARSQGAGAAQKKHHMFAKRYFNEQHHHPSSAGIGGGEGAVSPASKLEMKYSCSLEFAARPHHDPHAPPPLLPEADHIGHNHTYQLPGLPEGAGTSHHNRRPSRDKNKTSKDEHLTRDEKRARAMDVPITVEDIINLPMDEFNERLSKYDLTEAQLSLIRDIRRRGKNKVAAQNCRKRKLDQILSLADEVKIMRHRKNRLLRDKDCMQSERQQLKEKFSQLYRHVFQSLRDSEGRAYSPYEFSLQQSADGSVLLVPRKDEPKPPHHPSRPPH